VANDDVWDRRLWTRNERLSLGRNAMNSSGSKLLALCALARDARNHAQGADRRGLRKEAQRAIQEAET